jgi:hypothetical protein
MSVQNKQSFSPMAAMLIAVVLSAIISFGIVSVVGQTKSAAKDQVTTTQDAVTKMQVSVDTAIKNINNTIAGINKTVADQVTSQTSQISSQLSTIQGSVSTASTNANTATSNVNSMQSSISDLQAKLKTLSDNFAIVKTQDGINTTDITGVKSGLADLKTQLDKLSATVTALGTSGTGTDTGTGTGTTGVTASVVGNVFTGITNVSIPSLAVSSSQSQTFTFQVDNATGAALSNISFALALQTQDVSGNLITLPSNIVVSIASGNPALTWTNQSTGIGYVLGYSSNVNTSGFTSLFGGFSVKSGVSQYSQTITVQNTSATTAYQAFTIVPIIKVISFSK